MVGDVGRFGVYFSLASIFLYLFYRTRYIWLFLLSAETFDKIDRISSSIIFSFPISVFPNSVNSFDKVRALTMAEDEGSISSFTVIIILSRGLITQRWIYVSTQNLVIEPMIKKEIFLFLAGLFMYPCNFSRS